MTMEAPWAEVEVGLDLQAAVMESAKLWGGMIVRLIAAVVTPLACFITMYFIDGGATDRAWQLTIFMGAFGLVLLMWAFVRWLLAYFAAKGAATPSLLIARGGILHGSVSIPWAAVESVEWKRGKLTILGDSARVQLPTKYLVTKKATLNGIFQTMSNGLVGINGLDRSGYSVFSV